MSLETVGREDEIAALHAFLDRAGDGPGALVLEGEAGIGKTTLWLAAVEMARERSLTVLAARPAEAEQDLAYVALGDLLESWLDDLLPLVPAVRRRALEAALLLGADEHFPVDPRALALGVHSSLRALAERGPFVVAIDDVQWVDAPSATALGFALRRLEQEQVVTLFARRTEPDGSPSELESALPARERMAVGPLSLGAVQGLVRATFGRPLPRPTLVRLHGVSGGNPFYALELARAVLAVGPSPDPSAPFPFPESLQELVGERLRRLPEDTRRALLVVAALGRASTALVAEAGVSADALAPAVESRVVDVGDEVGFTHPLLASEAYSSASDAARRDVHRLLTEVVSDPVTRARHLALTLEGPDEQAAARLEEAAAAARGRGAPSVSAELGEVAARNTPADAPVDRHRRIVRAAYDHLAAGSAERAFVLARDAVDRAPTGRRRAEAVLLLGMLEDAAGSAVAALAHFREALSEAAGVPDLELMLHEQLALNTRITGSLTVAEQHARAALELAEELGDDGLTSRALGALATVRCNSGGADAIELARRALDLAARNGDRATIDDARITYVHCHLWACRLDDARRVLLELERSAAEHDEPILSNALWYRALLEQRAGRLALARQYAERSYELGVQYAGPDREGDPILLGPLASVAALQGEEQLARTLAQRALDHEQADAKTSTGRFLRQLLARLDHWGGDNAAALERFAEVEEERQTAGFAFRMATYAADLCETLLELGRLEDAAALLDDWEREAVANGHDWGLAEIVRSRGLVAAARGDLDQANALLERAISDHETAGDPFGRARALHALGVMRRRQRRKRPARDAIEAAVAVFEEMGAAGWADKARAELGRIGGRTKVDGLTPAERRVAVLVAEGRTNKEVAAELFLGERTVETHLTHIYAKLGVRSRAQLARTLR